ncbi:MAG: DUF4381 domain-containing protein [Pseudomonadota bacterium]
MTPTVPPYRRGGGFGSLGVRFREVLEPHVPPWRPETLGAWLTLGLFAAAVVAAIAWFVWRAVRRRYRRTAERELQALRARFQNDPQGLDALEAVPAVIKRCALGSFARSQVAALSGERWIAFLSSTGGEPFGEAASRALLTLTTRGAAAVSGADAASLFVGARTWIQRHRAEL